MVQRMMTVEEMIKRTVDEQVDKILKDEYEHACARLAVRMADAAPELALKCLRFYDVHNHGDRIVITVKPSIEPEGG
jgi:hypothetical protein